MTPAAMLYGYSSTGSVLTLVLPLGLFIVVMIAVYLVFNPRRRAPKPVAPEPQVARDPATAAGFPTATSGGGLEPLADRATPPRAGALREDIPADGDDTAVTDTAVSDTAIGDSSADELAPGKPTEPE